MHMIFTTVSGCTSILVNIKIATMYIKSATANGNKEKCSVTIFAFQLD